MTSISLPGASGSFFVRSVFTSWACVAVANPNVKINTERMSFFMLCIASVLSVMCCDIRWRGPESSRINADDRLSLASLGPVEGGNGIVEGSHFADVCPQPTNPKPLDELTQLGAIGYDDEVDSQAARGPRLRRAGDGHQRSSDANHARRPLRDVAAEDIENQIDFADVFQGV